MRTVLYSATFGGYDVVPALPASSDVDRVMFTDDPNLVAPEWEIEVAPTLPGEHPRMAAKRYKLDPSTYLPTYGRRVWMDASTELLDPGAIAVALSCLNGTGLAVHRHPDRDCIYPEARASLTMEKYQGQPIAAQVASYRRGGHPGRWGLWAGGVIASDRRADVLLAHWWGEVLAWSWQDQLALPVVMRRAGVRPGEIPHRQTASPWFRPGGHTRED